MDPTWEFQTIRALVEHMPLSLLGLGLVFYGETDFRSKWERQLLKFLSWAALLVGVFFLFLILLLSADCFGIQNKINYQDNSQLTQQLFRLQQLENKVSKGTAKDINDVANLFKNQGLPLDVKNFQEMKRRLLSEIANVKEKISFQAKAAVESKRFFIIKTSVKWSLKALVTGFMFVYIWSSTGWARRGSRRM